VNKLRYYIGLIFIFFLLTPVNGTGQDREKGDAPYQQELTRDGIRLSLSIDYIDNKKIPGQFRKGDRVRFRLIITDALTRQPLSGLNPAAWVDSRFAGESCAEKIKSILSGDLIRKVALDLGKYFVLILTADPSLTVVDPAFGFGGSQKIALVPLSSPGVDWALSPNKDFVFVSMPASRQVAVIRTDNWKVVKNIPVPAPPGQLAIQPDGALLWVDCPGDKVNGMSPGLAVIDLASLTLKTVIPMGEGPHDIRVRKDSRYVFVTNTGENNVIAVDTRSLTVAAAIPTCPRPNRMDILGNNLCIASEETGCITWVDAEKLIPVQTGSWLPGIAGLAFEPGGRYLFMINSRTNQCAVLDASTKKIIHTVATNEEPFQLGFSGSVAYIAHRKTEFVYMIPLDIGGYENKDLPVTKFPAGEKPPAELPVSGPTTIMAADPSANAILIANPNDRNVYFYKEGMAVPMGNIGNSGTIPLAIMILDNSFREVSPGIYETVGPLPDPGSYDFSVFLDSPRFIHCFPFDILVDSGN